MKAVANPLDDCGEVRKPAASRVSSITDVVAGLKLGRGWMHKVSQRRRGSDALRLPKAVAVHRTINKLEDLSFDLFRDQKLRMGRKTVFNAWVFMFELVTHLFYPLTIPVVVLVQGREAAINKGFLPGSKAFGSQVIYSVIFLVPVIFHIVRHVRGLDNWATTPIVFSTIFGAFRLLVIAGKYASFGRRQYEAVLAPGYDCIKELLLNTVITSFERADEMLAEAERETGIQLKEVKFLLADGFTSVNARVYANSLVRKVFVCTADLKKAAIGMHIFRSAVSIFVALYPLVCYLRAPAGTEHGGAASIALLVLVSIHLLFYSNIVFGFLMAAGIHYHRLMELKAAHASSLLFTASPATAITILDGSEVDEFGRQQGSGVCNQTYMDDEEDADQAMIPACSADNIVVWATVGAVLGRYASTLTRRICFNFAANLLVCLFLAGVLLLQVWVGGIVDVPFIGAISFVFAVTACGMLVSSIMAYFANSYDEQVIKRLEEENFAFLWRERMARFARNAATDISRPDGVVELTDGIKPVAPGDCGIDQLPPPELATLEMQRRAGDEDAMDAALSKETFLPFLAISDHRQEATEYKEAMDIVREILQRRSDEDKVKVMYIGSTIELVSFFVSLVASGVMLIVGILYQSMIPVAA